MNIAFPTSNEYRQNTSLFKSKLKGLTFGDYVSLGASFLIWIKGMSGENVVEVAFHKEGLYYPVSVDFTKLSTVCEVTNAINESLTGKGYVENTMELVFSDTLLVDSTISLQMGLEGNSFYLSGKQSIINKSNYTRYLNSIHLVALDIDKNPKKVIHEVNLLTPEEMQLWTALNSIEQEYHSEGTLHETFAKTARQYTSKVAITEEGHSITFGELDALSNAVGHELVDYGITVGDYVAVYMDRSINTIVSMLGVMKAGAVYVPISPDNPPERNKYILEDTKTKIVISFRTYADDLDKISVNIPTLALDNVTPEEEPVNIAVSSTDIAYIIYTSGSTGNPKGVKINHKSIVEFGHSMLEVFPITDKDVITQFYTLTFDASYLEVCPMLFTGARMHMLNKVERVDITSFATMVEEQGISYITAFPVSVLKQFSLYATDADVRKVSTIKRFGVGGEALTGEIARLFQVKFGDIPLVNIYGPTECTVASSMYVLDKPLSQDVVSVPIGYPLTNYKFYVVNKNNQLNPIGVSGELLIDTVAISDGYLNLPDKTNESFVTTPITDRLVYRTGDMAKITEEGSIEFVGRGDSQLKIRGYRVELGEIEDKLLHVDAIEVGVVVCKEIDGDKSLVAYYTVKEGSTLSSKTIIESLEHKLPNYMIPSYLIELNEFPLLPNGKIDRKQLVSRDLPTTTQASHTDITSPIEKQLADVWCDVLHLDSVGVEDNFFEIGGHSLKVLETLTKLKKDFPTLHINDFFERPTIKQLASKLEEDSLSIESTIVTTVIEEQTPNLYEHPVQLQTYQSYNNVKEQSSILLTGATGYLGSHILLDLLRDTDVKVYALVRAESQEKGMIRIRESVNPYATIGWYEKYNTSNRLHILAGDFTKDSLGLSHCDEVRLGDVTSIIHCGADVRHFGAKETFDSINVRGTENLLKFAKKRGNIRFHYISSVGVSEDLRAEGHWMNFLQGNSISEAPQLTNLYSNSKLESEKLVEKYHKEGVPSTIYRPANISCQYDTGIFQRNIESNAVYRSLKSFILLGKAPALHANMDFTMVDYASKAITTIALADETIGGVYNICNTYSFSFEDVLKAIQSYGYRIDTVTPSEFENFLYSSEYKNKEGLDLAMSGVEGDGIPDEYIHYLSSRAQAILNKSGVECPEPNEAFIHRMLDHAVEVGFLPKADMLVSA